MSKTRSWMPDVWDHHHWFSFWFRTQITSRLADATRVQTDDGTLPVWWWWETGLWGSGCETGVNLSVRCGSLGEAHKTMSGSSSSLSGLRSNTIPRPASAAEADPRSPMHTSAQEYKKKIHIYDFEINLIIINYLIFLSPISLSLTAPFRRHHKTIINMFYDWSVLKCLLNIKKKEN